MKQISKLLLFGALLLALLSTACGADQGAAPTLIGTTLPDGIATSTQPNALDIATTEATTPPELPTMTPSTPAVGAAESVATQVVTVAATNRSSLIPITGLDIVLVECQFCVDNIAHALLVLPDTATFEVVSSTTTTTSPQDVNCSTVEVNNGRQVVLCQGPEMSPITLNICANNSCADFPVDLLACPLAQTDNSTTNRTQSTPEAGAGTVSTPAITSTP
jgi:hypothetical protein